MKTRHIVLASALLVSVSSFAQKDELKKLKKIYEKSAPTINDVSEYKATLNALQPLATAEADNVYYGFYKAMTPIVEIMSLGATATPEKKAQIATPKVVAEVEKGLNATLDYEKKVGKKVYTDDILAKIALFKPELLNGAIALGDAKRYKESASLLHSIYMLDKSDVDMLFYAAGYSVNAEDYDKSIEYYNELKRLNYSGESTNYFATNKATKVEESFGNKQLRDISVNSAKTHEKPRDEKTPSKRGEIYKNVALILVQQGKTNEAITAIQDARKINPDDESLLFTEMDLYLKLNDFDKYTNLVNEALAKNPNNADLVFNLGVISGNAEKIEEAKKYYMKAIEIKPDYVNAYVNLSEVMLRADEKFVDEMNKLGTSEKDNKRYAVIKAEREKNFKSILPYLEKAVELDPTNEPAKKTLLSVYNALEMTDKYKALKNGDTSFLKSSNSNVSSNTTNNTKTTSSNLTNNKVIVVKMVKKSGGTYEIPCIVNGVPMNFVFDTGASDVTISLTEAKFLLKQGKLSSEDIMGTEKYQIANGEIEEGYVINLKSLEFGGLTLYNVKASVVKNLNAPLLLGQSALGRFGKITIDNNSSTLTIEK